MRMLLAIVLLLPLASVAAPAWAQQAQPPIRTMAIDGLGEVRARPDMATIMVGVVQQGGTAGEALKANSQAMNQILATLRSMKIAETDIQTSNFQISPRYDYGPNNQGPPKITGYEVSNQLAVTVRDLPKLGGLLDDIVRVGSNQISSVAFSFASPEHMRMRRGSGGGRCQAQGRCLRRRIGRSARGDPDHQRERDDHAAGSDLCQADARRGGVAGADRGGRSRSSSHG